MKKRTLLICLMLAFVSASSFAFFAPLILAVEACVANATMCSALATSVSAHLAVMAYQFNSSTAASGSKPIAAVIAPTKQRVTPASDKWLPAATGEVDPKPVATYPSPELSGLTPIPATWPDVIDDMAGESQKLYKSSSGAVNLRAIKVVTTTILPGAAGMPTTDADGYSRQWYRNYPAGSVYYQYVYNKTYAPTACDPGYSYTTADNNCTLMDSTKVMKPSDTPCEVRMTGSTYLFDARNPNCTQFAKQVQITGTQMYVRTGAQKASLITQNSDGAGGINIKEFSSDGTDSVDFSPYSAQTGGYTANTYSHSSDTSNTPDYSTGGTGTSGSGGTSGTSSGGSCGGPGQPACALDDSGFNGKATDGNGLLSKITQNDQSITDKLNSTNSTDTHGIDWTWIPSVPRVACTPFQFGKGSHTISFDLCETFAVIRQALGWLLYILTAWGLFDLFTQGTVNRGKGK